MLVDEIKDLTKDPNVRMDQSDLLDLMLDIENRKVHEQIKYKKKFEALIKENKAQIK